MRMHSDFNNHTLHNFFGQGGNPHHVACFGSVVIHRSPVPKNIRAIVTNTEILRPATRLKKIKMLKSARPNKIRLKF